MEGNPRAVDSGSVEILVTVPRGHDRERPCDRFTGRKDADENLALDSGDEAGASCLVVAVDGGHHTRHLARSGGDRNPIGIYADTLTLTRRREQSGHRFSP